MIRIQKKDNSVYVLLISFFIVFVLIGVWIQQLMLHNVRENNQKHVTMLAELSGRRIHDLFQRELNDLIKLSVYFDIQGLDQVSLITAYSSNLIAKEGMVDLNGNLESGESVNLMQFPSVREAFRGKPAVSFVIGDGALFTVPILKNGNVQYVYYRYYYDDYVKSHFGLENVEHDGLKVNIVDAEDNIVIPFKGYSEEDAKFFSSNEIAKYQAVIRDRMRLTNSAAVYFNSERGDNYLFMAAIPGTDFYLSGYISEESVSEGMFKTINMLLVLYVGIVAMISLFLYFYYMDMKRRQAEVEERNRLVEQLSDEIMNALALTIDAKDKYTNGHSHRVAEYSVMLARKLGFSEEECDKVRHLALLHDIGKIGVPDAVLNKAGKLTDEEFNTIKSHTSVGSDILQTVKAIPDMWQGARWHHERYDGRGYPDKKVGEDIPLLARIIAVADTYDAMTSKRCYRDALPQQVARSEIVKGSGTQFDPMIAELMLQLIDEDKDYKLRQK